MAMDWGGKDIIGNRIQCTGVVEETTGNRKYAMAVANGREVRMNGKIIPKPGIQRP